MLLLAPSFAAAASFTFERTALKETVGSTLVIPIDIKVPGEIGVNAVSASLSINGPATIVEFET